MKAQFLKCMGTSNSDNSSRQLSGEKSPKKKHDF